jgi:hypothetical protein
MAVKYAVVENDQVEIHHDLELDEPPTEAIKLTDEEYEMLALGRGQIVKGKVKSV